MLIDKHLIDDYMESEINSSKIHRLTDKLVEMENEMMKELNDKQKDLFWKYMECAELDVEDCNINYKPSKQVQIPYIKEMSEIQKKIIN